jgi:hypothetical protein
MSVDDASGCDDFFRHFSSLFRARQPSDDDDARGDGNDARETT